MSGQCELTVRFESRLRWETDTNLFHRVVQCGQIVWFTVKCVVKQKGSITLQVWRSMGQASNLVLASACSALWAEQMISVTVQLFAPMEKTRTY